MNAFLSPGDSDHSAGHHTDQVVFNGEKGSMWAAIAEGDPEPLGVAQGDINTKLSWRAHHAEGKQISGTASHGLDAQSHK